MPYTTFHWLLDLGQKKNFHKGTLSLSWIFFFIVLFPAFEKGIEVLELLSDYYKVLNDLNFH